MEISVVTIFPELVGEIAKFGMTRKAVEIGALQLGLYNPRDYTEDRHRTVDDRPYGGGPGMLMKPEPLAGCIDEASRLNPGPVIYLSPQGELLNHGVVSELAGLSGLTLVSGRYEGIDERIIETRVDREISIGDYVLAGGELPAMVVIDAIARLLPGVLGNEQSVNQDSFSNGLLDCPHYTRPECFEGLAVPPVLLSGDHEKIKQWRLKRAIAKTKERRPNLIHDPDQVKENSDNEN